MKHPLLTLAAVVAIAVGCTDNRPQLTFAADPSVRAGLASSNARPGAPVSFGAIMLCLSAPATATIRSVAIHESQGEASVTAFAVRPNPFPRGQEGLGGLNVGLAAYGSGFAPGGPQLVRGVCPINILAPTLDEARSLAELGVEVQLRSGAIGGGPALDVTYSTDGSSDRVATIPFSIWLCADTCPVDVGAASEPPH